LNENYLKWAAVIFLVTTIISSSVAIYTNYQFTELKRDYELVLDEVEELSVKVDLKIDYCNGTIVWYNDTRAPVGSTLLFLTEKLTNLKYDTGEWGIFVNSINGVGGDTDTWWLWSYFDSGWKPGSTGAHAVIVHEGDIFEWKYSTI
jgi:hypothetical protein